MNAPESSLPIAEPGVSRREFVCLTCLGAAAAFLAGCGITGPGVSGPPDSVSLTIKLSDYPALDNVGGIALLSDRTAGPLAVVRTGGAAFVALSRICPHQGGTIGTDGSGFRCPNHGATFDETGTWIGGQPTSNMRSYGTHYDAAAGTITIG